MSIKDALELKLKEICKLRINRNVYDEISRIAEHYAEKRNCEWAGILVGDLEKVTRQITFAEGEINASSCSWNVPIDVYVRRLGEIKEGEYLLGIWHSHPPAYEPRHSATDLTVLRTLWANSLHSPVLPFKVFYKNEKVPVEIPIKYNEENKINVCLENIFKRSCQVTMTVDPEFAKSLKKFKQPILNVGFRHEFNIFYFHSFIKGVSKKSWHSGRENIAHSTKFNYKTSECLGCGEFYDDATLDGEVEIV